MYSFQPNQRLNFLCGENGSGKSAVLTAIVFGLGGSARTSSRGNSNKGFIRTGQTSAVVEIKLCNEGEKAYKPEVYGDSITVMRTVTNSSSTYKLKDHRGHVVVEKKVKEELDRVLMSFNIQVDNPIAVLNQDTAKTFLFKCEPDKLYTFFMRATQLETCKADYNAAAIEKTTAEKHLEEKKASLPELKKELAKWEKKYEFHQNLNVRKQDVKVKKAELSWAVVRDKEMEASTAEEEAEEQKKKISKCEQTIGEYSTKEKSLREEKMAVEAEIQKLADTREEETNKLDQLKKDSDMKREKARALKKTLGELERQRDKVSRRAKTLVDEINRLRANASEYEEKHKERKREISNLENQAVSLNAQIDTTSNHSNQLRENLKSVEQQEAQAMTDLKRHQGKVTKSKTELQGLRNSGNDKLATFGAWMPRLVQEVAR